MTSLEQAEALLQEYAELVKQQQGEIIDLKKQIEDFKATIQELQFEMCCQLNKEYDV
jgi:Tfp pilus assembly protein PilN